MAIWEPGEHGNVVAYTPRALEDTDTRKHADLTRQLAKLREIAREKERKAKLIDDISALRAEIMALGEMPCA